jgi:hypothetical protein
MGSLAPMGPGQAATSTVPSISSDSGGGSDIPFGALAGGAGLAALLAAQGDDGSGLSFGNILSGAKELFNLGDLSDIDILGELPQELQNAVKSIMDAPGDLMESLFGADAVPIGELGSATAAQATATGNAMIASGAEAASNLAAANASVATSTFFPYTGTPSLYAPTTMGMGSIPTVGAAGAAGAAGAVGSAGLLSSAPYALAEFGGAGAFAGTGVGAGAGGLASMGAMGPMALAGIAFMALQAMKDPPDPTLNTRRLNQIENMMQKGGGGIAALEQFLYNEPYTLDLIKAVTSGGGGAEPFGTPHTSGGTKLISWSPNVSKKVQENMHLLEAASHAGQVAGSQGMDTPLKQAAYSDVKKGATFNAANDPWGHREREAAAGGDYGEFDNYVPSGRDLAAMARAQYASDDHGGPGGDGGI